MDPPPVATAVAAAPTGQLEYMINHVFLPPKTPQEDDTSTEKEHALISSFLQTAKQFAQTVTSPAESQPLGTAIRMIARLLKSQPGLASKQKNDVMQKVIRELKNGECLLLHIRCQNAGLLFTGRQDDILVEAFELLASNNDVMSCQGRLMREFPDCAAVISRTVMYRDSFLSEFVNVLCQLELHSSSIASTKSKKSDRTYDEERDTNSPSLVTDMVIGTLAGIGSHTEPQRISKRIWEQVTWSSALLPFHRSATWVLLRIALRLVLDRNCAPSADVSLYKALLTFFHGRLLQQAGQASLGSDLLFAMGAKVARRIVKSNPQQTSPWLHATRHVVKKNAEILQQRWREIQDSRTSVAPDTLEQLCFQSDSNLGIEHLRRHLSWIESRSSEHQGTRGPGDGSVLACLPVDGLPRLGRDEMSLLLVESWVESNLETWLAGRLKVHAKNSAGVSADLVELQTLIEHYHNTASIAYDKDSEALSAMYLIIMELWVALDRITTQAIPLLRDYQPCLPPAFLDRLLLPTRAQMVRLQAVEVHLSKRLLAARNGYGTPFDGFGDTKSFAIRYFDSSLEHQQLLGVIQRQAEDSEALKLQEFREMRSKFDRLSLQQSRTNHNQEKDYYRNQMVCKPDCAACQLKRQISGLRIDIFEWPLPANLTLSKAIVFEISVPREVVVWRDTTTMLFLDVFPDPSSKKSKTKIWYATARSGLANFVTGTSRVQLASTAKPVEATHYRGKHISTICEGEVCVRHQWATYDYYDATTQYSGKEVLETACLSASCSFARHHPLEPLFGWIASFRHTSNDVIAAQSRCPTTMSMEESRAFGHFRSGVHLQWPNVLCQLLSPSLNWNNDSTFHMVLQACLEAGPANSNGAVLRTAHLDLLSDEFVGRVLLALDGALVRLRENWQNENGVCLLACLATRVLSLTDCQPLVNLLLEFLSQLRGVAIGWARDLLKKISNCTDPKIREELNDRVSMAALICTCTFNIEQGHLRTVLRSPDSLAILVEAAILAHNHSPAVGHASKPIQAMLLNRWRRTMHRSLGILEGEILEHKNPGFHRAIQSFWADYVPWATHWSGDTGDRRHIMDGRMMRKDGQSIDVSINLLKGLLLVNGYPLSRLPEEYVSHATYQELFGRQILEIIPSTRKGMRFSACRDQQGWIVDFAMVGSELVIQAAKPSTEEETEPQLYEFIPSSKLGNDVPNSFRKRHKHWLNHTTGEIEFRLAEEPWVISSSNWHLTRKDRGNFLSRNGCFLVDPHSPTADALSTVFKPLETTDNIDIVLQPDGCVVVLDLPRLVLTFTLKAGQSSIRSKQYSDMKVDECQSIGTLAGLRTKLVLKQQGVPESCTPIRKVLVPRGPLSSQLVSNHVAVSVISSGQLHTRHDAFTVDSRLGCLRSSGSFSSRLYLCHLHALTSHCLPDSLTGRTGTEEALQILRSASTRSFQRLDLESYNLLIGIAKMSPGRRFYPSHLQNMEQVEWSGEIPVLSQHDEFWPAVELVLSQAKECELLYPLDAESTGKPDFDSIKRCDPLLSQRARMRNAVFRVSDFGAEEHTAEHDRPYLGRHRMPCGQRPKKSVRVEAVTREVVSDSQMLVQQPSCELRESILTISGEQFLGDPQVDITFHIEHLLTHSESLRGLWCGLHRSLTQEENKYKIVFFLSALIHAKNASWDIVQALMGMVQDRSKFGATLMPPNEDSFDLQHNMSSLRGNVDKIIEKHLRPFEECPETKLPPKQGESSYMLSRRRHATWEDRSAELARLFGSRLEGQWLGNQGWAVSTPTGENFQVYMHCGMIMQEVRLVLDLTWRTVQFETYLDKLVEELARMGVQSLEGTEQEAGNAQGLEERGQRTSQLGFVRSNSLFLRPAPPTKRPQVADFTYLCQQVKRTVSDHDPLTALFDRLSDLCGDKPYQVAYINELRNSAESTASPRYRLEHDLTDLNGIFEQYLLRCKQTAEQNRRDIEVTLLNGHTIADSISQDANVHPRVSTAFLLRRLTRQCWDDLSKDWQQCLINYGLSLAYWQRAERLVNASTRSDRRADLLKELLNLGSHGCDKGDPLIFPESLVLELEQGILIRPVQQEIAAKMREPPGGQNSVMQLNMGEGKSSVIVPIVCTALADGSRLVRVVVAKPQFKQMMHTLITTLGGLINRQIFYLPISRAVRLTGSDIQAVNNMLVKCREQGGVLLVQPEQVLSFKLMALEKIWVEGGGRGGLGQCILESYRGLEDVCRDIVDESDENFSVKFELIYTMGTQQPVGMGSNRWTIIQGLMDIVLEVAKQLADSTATDGGKGLLFEEDAASGRFPTIRVLEAAADQNLVNAIATQVCRTGLDGFQIQNRSKRMRKAVFEYIVQQDLSASQVDAVEQDNSGLFAEIATRDILLLLRGLLASGVLVFALGQKRFRVNYGLAPNRRPPTMLAVPYRAKDSPAPRSEFSHPDVVIVLTCLTYYYRGLSDDELRSSLEILGKSDRAEQEYSTWASASPNLPPSLRHFSGINLKDSALCEQKLFPAMRYSKPAIDYYLSNVVFPREMREFPFKLSASGWDLGKAKQHPLTGFSGTSDSKYVLPLSVTALDLPEQRHTNSAVLACLLQDENIVLELGGDQDDLCAVNVTMLLKAITTSAQPIRVILDVGAQITDLENLQVAQRWLDLVPSQDVDAVVFFNEQDELSVLMRTGMVDPFLTSPFAAQTSRCLVFLDQAHTRGTDLRLPDSYRAAVLTGPWVTKDALIQACMRMRKLGNGQSVTFCVSPEMQKRIRMLGKIDTVRPLTVVDILACAVVETWDDADRSLPLFATQGIRHQHQEIVWDRASKRGELSAKDVGEYLEDEARSLEQRYRPGETGSSLVAKLDAAQSLEGRQKQVAQIRAKCHEVGLAHLDLMASLQEEQERELAPEVEAERQVERPAPMDPRDHALHSEVKGFAVSGILKRTSGVFIPAFQSLKITSAVRHYLLASFPSELLVTADFARTIRNKQSNALDEYLDAYQRPVQWLLTQATSTAPHGMHMVIVSPFEANKLKPLLMKRTANPPVHLRAYMPRTSLSFPSFEDLSTYVIPFSTSCPAITNGNGLASSANSSTNGNSSLPSYAQPPPPSPAALVTQLNLFAGQLYLRSYDEYVRMCQYLGLAYTANDGDGDVAADGFVGKAKKQNDGTNRTGYEACKFEKSPVAFLNVLFKRVRRDCVDIERTHMGRVLAGGILRKRDFEGDGYRVGGGNGVEGHVGQGAEEGAVGLRNRGSSVCGGTRGGRDGNDGAELWGICVWDILVWFYSTSMHVYRVG